MSCFRLIHGMSHGSDASKTSASEQRAYVDSVIAIRYAHILFRSHGSREKASLGRRRENESRISLQCVFHEDQRMSLCPVWAPMRVRSLCRETPDLDSNVPDLPRCDPVLGEDLELDRHFLQGRAPTMLTHDESSCKDDPVSRAQAVLQRAEVALSVIGV